MLKIIDFFAPWCAPCRALKPILKELRTEYPNIEIQEIDVEINGELAVKNGVKNIPFIVFQKDDEIVEKLIGLQSKEKLISLINKHNG